jgi:hypothetical protein
MQYFKGDETELKTDAVGQPAFDLCSADLDDFYDDAYDAYSLGELIYDNELSPLANAIKREIFRVAFNEIFQAFTVGGTFESYLSVFRRIFGDTVDIQFTVPAAGKLEIAIEASEVELSNFLVRELDVNTYTFFNLVDQAGDKILLQTVKGFQSQYELEQMLYELVPAGVYTEITLSFGG